MGRLIYVALGFAVGYMIDMWKENQQEESAAAHKMENIEVVVAEPAVTEPVKKKAAKTDPPTSAKSVKKTKPAKKTATVVEDVVEEASPAFLKKVEGIGPTYAKRLYGAGIRSLSKLAQSDPAEITEIAKLRNPAKAEDWISQAKVLVG